MEKPIYDGTYETEIAYDCYIKPSRYYVWRKAREAREFWNDLSWYAQRDRKHEKPEPKKNRPYYRALENKKWRF